MGESERKREERRGEEVGEGEANNKKRSRREREEAISQRYEQSISPSQSSFSSPSFHLPFSPSQPPAYQHTHTHTLFRVCMLSDLLRKKTLSLHLAGAPHEHNGISCRSNPQKWNPSNMSLPVGGSICIDARSYSFTLQTGLMHACCTRQLR